MMFEIKRCGLISRALDQMSQTSEEMLNILGEKPIRNEGNVEQQHSQS